MRNVFKWVQTSLSLISLWEWMWRYDAFLSFCSRVHSSPRTDNSIRVSVMCNINMQWHHINSIQFSSVLVQFSSIRFSLIQFDSIQFGFPSKQTHLKNTQDGRDAPKSTSLKNGAPALHLKNNNNKQSKIMLRQAKNQISMYIEMWFIIDM